MRIVGASRCPAETLIERARVTVDDARRLIPRMTTLLAGLDRLAGNAGLSRSRHMQLFIASPRRSRLRDVLHVLERRNRLIAAVPHLTNVGRTVLGAAVRAVRDAPSRERRGAVPGRRLGGRIDRAV